MSDTDSFIEEVTEEVRRDRLFALLKRYGWIAALVIVAVVAGTSYNEYRKAQDRAAAEALGDEMIAALGQNATQARAAQLSTIEAETPGGRAILEFMIAAAEANSGQTEDAVAGLNQIAIDADLPEIYRQIATFKALTLQTETLSPQERQLQFEALAQPGQPLRLLAQEQLALIEISQNQPDAAIARLQAILDDAESNPDLQQRAAQLIVALGGTPELRDTLGG